MRRLARLAVVAGAVAIGWFLLERGGGRQVELVYALQAADAAALSVRISRGGELVRRAEFRRPGEEVRHRVRLPDGEYALAWSIERAGGPPQAGERALEVRDDQTIVLDLRGPAARP